MALRSAKVDGLQLWVTWWNISSSLKNKSERVRGREERCENRREKELHSQFYNSDPKDSELVGVGGGGHQHFLGADGIYMHHGTPLQHQSMSLGVAILNIR